jgi:DNA-directed RNA polymerase subunit L
MNVNILKKGANEIRIEIEGESHTFCNVLQKALLEDESVETASYYISHPLVSKPILYVKMKEKHKPEKKPETILEDAAEKILNQIKKFRVSFEKTLKKWQQK